MLQVMLPGAAGTSGQGTGRKGHEDEIQQEGQLLRLRALPPPLRRDLVVPDHELQL